MVKAYLGSEFNRGQNKGAEHRQKIVKFLKKVYANENFLCDAYILSLYASIFVLVGMLPNIDIKSSIQLIYASSFLISLAFMCFIIGIFKQHSAIEVKKIIKKYHIDVIK